MIIEIINRALKLEEGEGFPLNFVLFPSKYESGEIFHELFSLQIFCQIW